jgi:quercetin dioxygenase-like cupin family protein
MNIDKFPFTIPDWAAMEPVERRGVTGTAVSRIFKMGGIGVRMVEYSAGYLADHWCHKGHIIYCIEGDMEARLENGASHQLTAGMSCHMGSDGEAHRMASVNGCKLFIVD